MGDEEKFEQLIEKLLAGELSENSTKRLGDLLDSRYIREQDQDTRFLVAKRVLAYIEFGDLHTQAFDVLRTIEKPKKLNKLFRVEFENLITVADEMAIEEDEINDSGFVTQTSVIDANEPGDAMDIEADFDEDLGVSMNISEEEEAPYP